MDAARLDDLVRKHGILLAVHFGSSVSGQMYASSDSDIAVLLERAPDSLAAYADLIADFQARELCNPQPTTHRETLRRWSGPIRSEHLTLLCQVDPPVQSLRACTN
ncbi:MAG: hypothetical protein H0U94_14625, partial [Acidobacteria bacterium]|nr:hypothetical protein [Acidobacteriota bacterium]